MVVLGGLHVLSCPDEVAPHADALVVGEGVQVWRTDPPRRRGGRRCRAGLPGRATAQPYRDDPPPAARPAAARCVPDHDQPDRHARLPQPLRLLLPRHRRAAHALPGARRRSRSSAEFRADGQPYGVFIDNNLGSRAGLPAGASAAPCGRWSVIWSAAVTIDVTDDPSLVREMALAGCTGVFVGFESLTDENLADARKKTPADGGLRPAGAACCTTTASRSTAASSSASTTTARTSSRGRSTGSRRTGWSAPRSTS